MRTSPAFLLLALLPGASSQEKKPHKVLVWDEQQEEQKQVYPDYLGNAIAAHLKKQEGLEVRSASFKEPEQGLSDANVDWADVILWWGHAKHNQVNGRAVARIVERVKAGECGFVAIHSAQGAKPFKSLMLERFKQDVLAKLPADVDRSKVEFILGKEGAPAVLKQEPKEGKSVITVAPPMCMIRAWRHDAAPSHVEVKAPDHPIAKGLPLKFDVKVTEMYDEPFTVPEPDTVVFFETWDKGEKFRGGCCWNVGKGRVFYFRPGHETYPVFLQEEPLKILHNAALWVGRRT